MKAVAFKEVNEGQAFRMFRNGHVYIKDHCEGAYRRNNLGERVHVDFIPAGQKVEIIENAA